MYDQEALFFCSFTERSPDLKRFSDSNNRTNKLSTYVNFPLKDLDMQVFSSGSSGKYPMMLMLKNVSLTWQTPSVILWHWLKEVFLVLVQSKSCTTCMQCPTTVGTPWAVTTRPTARMQHWGSGTTTTTAGIKSWLVISSGVSRTLSNLLLATF